MDLKFGLGTPSNLWSLDWDARKQAVSEIADSGFDHIFMADHVSFRNGSGTDGFVEVASLSQLHPTIGVMTGIYLLPLRHPLPVARQLASMARIAPGRLSLVWVLVVKIPMRWRCVALTLAVEVCALMSL